MYVCYVLTNLKERTTIITITTTTALHTGRCINQCVNITGKGSGYNRNQSGMHCRHQPPTSLVIAYIKEKRGVRLASSNTFLPMNIPTLHVLASTLSPSIYLPHNQRTFILLLNTKKTKKRAVDIYENESQNFLQIVY